MLFIVFIVMGDTDSKILDTLVTAPNFEVSSIVVLELKNAIIINKPD